MTEPNRCPTCGASLPDGTPESACPRCLLAAGLEAPEADEQASEGVPASLADRFPKLEIQELLGRGGMGIVYKARQKELDRLVALKVLPEEISTDPAFSDRFAREAKALARLDHPAIVRVHEFGEQGGLYYLLMEYVDGANLRSAMESGGLSPAEALAIVPQICDALQYAHEQGVVHRDIKPENVLLDRKGRVKIADFGLAKLVGAPQDESALTRAGQVMGTPHYMAPEQIEAPRDVDHRADIYSLGVVFYEMLTGELPLGRFDPPSTKVEVDVRLDDVVLRALEKQRGRRYQSVADVKTGMDDAARAPRPAAAAAAPPRRSAPTSPPVEPRMSKMAVAGFLTLPVAVVLGVLVIAGMHESGMSVAGFVPVAGFGLIAFVGWILSIVAWIRIHHSDGRLRGTAFAVLGTVMPLLAGCGSPMFWVLQRAPDGEAEWETGGPPPAPLREAGVNYYLGANLSLPDTELHALRYRVDELWGALQDGLPSRPLEQILPYLTPSERLHAQRATSDEMARMVEAGLLGIAFVRDDQLPAPFATYRLVDVHVVEAYRAVCVARTTAAAEQGLAFELHKVNGAWFFGAGKPETGNTVSFEGRTSRIHPPPDAEEQPR